MQKLKEEMGEWKPALINIKCQETEGDGSKWQNL